MKQQSINSVAKLGLKQGLEITRRDPIEMMMRAFGIFKEGGRHQEILTFQKYSISYWAYHAKKSTPERRRREPLYKTFALGAKLSPSLKWWFAQIYADNYSGSMRSQIMEISDEVLGDLSRSDQYPSKSRLGLLGAAFNLPEILGNGLNNYKEEVDAPLSTGRTLLLVAIRYGSPDSVKYLLDHGADPTRISVTRKRYNVHGSGETHRHLHGHLLVVEDMVYWVTGKSGNHQEPEGHLEVENFLLDHEKSRNHFLILLERHLRSGGHLGLVQALKALYRASNEVPISAKILEHRIKIRGLGKLAQVLELLDVDTFDEEMIAEVIRHDSCETVKKLFEFIHVDSITEQMVRNSLKSYYSDTIAYFMKQFGHDTLTREIVIDAEPQSPEVWKVILDVKGIQFVNQEVLDSLFNSWVDPEAVTLVLVSCGTDMVGSSHIETIAGSPCYALEVLNTIFRIRGSLDALITEEAVMKI